MLVVSLIGNHAGTVLNLPYVAAQNSLQNGTARVATEEEITGAGLESPSDQPIIGEHVMPVGYTAVWDPGWGYDVVLSGFADPLNTTALPNLAAAVDFAVAQAASVEAEIAAEIDGRTSIEIPANWQELNAADMRTLAANFSDDPVRNKGDGEAIITAELARRDAQAESALPAADAPANPVI